MKILLTGANGYIGMRLLPVLLNAGYEVVCSVRDKQRFSVETSTQDGLSVIEVDLLDQTSSCEIPNDIDAAYYLVHSMSDQRGNFRNMECLAAQNFIHRLAQTKCKRVIYLSGISNAPDLSEHLHSRLDVEGVLGGTAIKLTVLRAGIIMGSGSASFEIIRDLVEKLPVMIAPKWLQTRCQPIAVRNVINLLSGVLSKPETEGRVYDIGGPEILNYREMLLQFAEVRGLKRWIWTVPVLSPRISSMWLYFVTSTSFNLARNLVDSMKVDVIARPNNLRTIIPLEAINYKESVKLAFEKIEQNLVVSSWKDAVGSNKSSIANVLDYVKVPKYGCFKDQKCVKLSQSPEQVLENLWSLGGKRGWYYANFLWKMRGYLDKFAGGIGLRRGRRSPSQIYPGDALDFWRVIVASREQKRLLLYAEMRLPGEAWLEFKITNDAEGYSLHQIATFRPKGLIGRLYWYSVMPFHFFVFNGMINRIASFKPESIDPPTGLASETSF